MGTVAGRAAPSPESWYGELAPSPSVRAVIWNAAFPTLDTVSERAGPAEPQATSPHGSAGSVPNDSVLADTRTFP